MNSTYELRSLLKSPLFERVSLRDVGQKLMVGFYEKTIPLNFQLDRILLSVVFKIGVSAKLQDMTQRCFDHFICFLSYDTYYCKENVISVVQDVVPYQRNVSPFRLHFELSKLYRNLNVFVRSFAPNR